MAYGSTLMARLGLDTAGFKAGIAGAESALNRFAGKIGLGLSVAGLTQFAHGIIEYGDRIKDLSDRFNISSVTLQKFGNAAEKNGSSLEGMAAGFNKLEIAQSKALGGSSQVAQAFANLGISVEDLQTLSPDQLMLKLGNSSLNAADLVTVLGKSALSLRPTLKGLADGTIELGDALEDNLIKQLDAADDAFKTLWENIRIKAARAMLQVKGEIDFLGDGIKGMWGGARDYSVSALAAIGHAARGNFADAQRNIAEASRAYGRFHDAAFGDGKTSGARVEGGASLPGEAKETAAERKEKERTQLSLSDLAKLDPSKDIELRNNIQAAYASQQARQVQDLEAQAHRQLELNDPEGAGRTLSRAKEMRNSIGILKDSEKEIGTWVIDESKVGQSVARIEQALLAASND